MWKKVRGVAVFIKHPKYNNVTYLWLLALKSTKHAKVFWRQRMVQKHKSCCSTVKFLCDCGHTMQGEILNLQCSFCVSEVNTGNGADAVLGYTEELNLTLSFPFWEVITLSLAQERPHQQCSTQFWAPQTRRKWRKLERLLRWSGPSARPTRVDWGIWPCSGKGGTSPSLQLLLGQLKRCRAKLFLAVSAQQRQQWRATAWDVQVDIRRSCSWLSRGCDSLSLELLKTQLDIKSPRLTEFMLAALFKREVSPDDLLSSTCNQQSSLSEKPIGLV